MQQFVEHLCSSDGGVTDEWLEEIHRVIYDAHPLKSRLGTTTFDELLSARAAPVGLELVVNASHDLGGAPDWGCLNRHRTWPTKLDRLILRARRHGHRLSVAMLDIDRFKSVNDEHGHAAGDDVLVEVAVRIKDRLRGDDLVGRWAGGEFLLVLPEPPDEGNSRRGVRAGGGRRTRRLPCHDRDRLDREPRLRDLAGVRQQRRSPAVSRPRALCRQSRRMQWVRSAPVVRQPKAVKPIGSHRVTPSRRTPTNVPRR